MSILKAVKNYLKLYHANVRAPSAPAEEGPSAPIMSPTASSTFELTIRTQETFEAAEECVICLDAKVSDSISFEYEKLFVRFNLKFFQFKIIKANDY